VARLDLVRTLRELGLGLDVVQAVLARACTVAEVAAAHVTMLDAQIRTLRLRRAVLSTVARHGHTVEETLIMHKLARLSAQERQRIIDDFVDGIFQGTDPGAPAMGIARGMRQLPAELPDDPAPEQVDAWVELAELVASEDFRQRARSMVLAGQDASQAQADNQATVEPATVEPATVEPATVEPATVEPASQAAAQGIAPGSPEGKAVLDRIVAPGTTAAQRARLLGRLETFTDARVERYWQLLAVINGQPVPPSLVPGFEWLIAALRADLGQAS
jgi:cell division septation protein DedD